MENKIDQLKEKFVTACRILVNDGLAEAQFSLSCRLDKNRMLISDNLSPSLVTRENILTSSIDGEVVMGNVHPAIYKGLNE